MKKIVQIALGIWCAFTSFISPIWLTLMFLYITGEIYKYDYSIENGIAGILGTVLLMIWMLAVLLPDIWFLKKMYMMKRKNFFCAFVFLMLAAGMCTAMCGWDIVKFLTVPGGIEFGF